MVDLVSERECTGCSACYAACPKHAIAMLPDEKGFLRPQIDVAHCVHCGRCAQICPAIAGQQRWESRYDQPLVKAAWGRDLHLRYMSTSGGLFSVLAQAFLRAQGNVVGAVYGENFLVEHQRVDAVSELPRLRQSKYVQSDKKDTFQDVRTRLSAGERVLFVGAPCEVGGLYNFLGKAYERLITIDYICLGCNSPKVFLHFLQALEHRYGGKVTRIWFKNKQHGWNSFCTRVDFDNGKTYLKNRRHDYFMRGYIGKHKYYTRLSCTQCRYKGFPRQADITLADFWGIAAKRPEYDDDLGTSAVLLNSDKGRQLFIAAEPTVQSFDMTLKDVFGGNFALQKSVVLDPRREAFYRDLDRMEFDELIEKYCPKGWRERIHDVRMDLATWWRNRQNERRYGKRTWES